MKNITSKFIILVIVMAFTISCGGDSDSPVDPPTEPDPVAENKPTKAALTLPENGQQCTAFAAVNSDDTKAEISFSWEKSTYATAYILKIAQSGTEVVSKQISGTSTTSILDKGKTYSWTVVATNADGESSSETHSFTTPGNPVGNYVPYAAVISFDIDTTTQMATLSWVGADEDSEASELKYSVVVKEDNTIILSKENQTETTVADFDVTLNAIYEIQVNTIDAYGSYSTSVLSKTYK
ncbi:hypothetical protein [Leeuwenhoekiella sp. NPDC079379]|uniref:hypothetical protein n=1 Tax=Leeuwenhoekiella sp. NPDC079379 TaxID=3364122 RepID=UPI0037CC9088